ncbi:hypothetical protein QFA96_18525 [Pseudomonas sp. Ap32]|nr:hypothetical protein QFA96_18525 [Pseudomonas sp. Ap32]
MKVGLAGVRIAALTAALPEQRLALTELAGEFGAQEVKRIIHSTGIETVRIAGSLTTGALCEAAARHLLACSGKAAADIDAVVVVTQTPDDLMPGVAVQLQQRLGLSEHCVAFDINYGCSGYIYGLYQAAMLIRAGGVDRSCSVPVMSPVHYLTRRIGKSGWCSVMRQVRPYWRRVRAGSTC